MDQSVRGSFSVGRLFAISVFLGGRGCCFFGATSNAWDPWSWVLPAEVPQRDGGPRLGLVSGWGVTLGRPAGGVGVGKRVVALERLPGPDPRARAAVCQGPRLSGLPRAEETCTAIRGLLSTRGSTHAQPEGCGSPSLSWSGLRGCTRHVSGSAALSRGDWTLGPETTV